MKSFLISLAVLLLPPPLIFGIWASRGHVGDTGVWVVAGFVMAVCAFVASVIVIAVNYAGPRWW